MKILLLSFYYSPDLCAGSFRMTALINALLEQSPEGCDFDLITTLPNRYQRFSSEAPEEEIHERLRIRRVKLPAHQSGMVDQTKAFITFARKVIQMTRLDDYHMVFGTSSRLMTAALSTYVSRVQGIPIYLDIRDIFVDTIKDVLPGKAALAVKPVFSLLERWTMNRADKINLVSYGFKDYFQTRYPQKTLSFFTNGIDDEFIEVSRRAPREKSSFNKKSREPITALYAGNMGEGQGLHAIIPELAKRLEGTIRFRLIGDGGRRVLLEKRLAELQCGNVEILPPVKRDQLLVEYQNADILFLHLNDYDAFRKVLPSKLFEYAALGKPVWAGVAGYAAEFVCSEINNASVFPPCNVEAAVHSLGTLRLEDIRRTSFIEKYARDIIMRAMAEDVISLLPQGEKRQ